MPDVRRSSKGVCFDCVCVCALVGCIGVSSKHPASLVVDNWMGKRRKIFQKFGRSWAEEDKFRHWPCSILNRIIIEN